MVRNKENVKNENVLKDDVVEKAKTRKNNTKPKSEEKENVRVKKVIKEDSTIAQKKAEAIIDTVKTNKINGIRYIDVDENNKIFESRLLIEGQALPLFVVVNSTVYSYIHVHLVTISPEKLEKCNEQLNLLNDNFPMLKYFVNDVGNVVLTCSLPAANDKFDPGLLFALVDQVKSHLEDNYKVLMKKIWEE